MGSPAERLEEELAKLPVNEQSKKDRDRATTRIRLIMEGLARELQLSGQVRMFGSFSNGFKTGQSDLDIVFIGSVRSDQVISTLESFAKRVPDLGFENITKIFQANVPLVKFTDTKRLMEVDFCINNELGMRNSMLLAAYNRYDPRVLTLGKLIKEWAKKHDLVGTADGCLNSYAYMLLVIHYLQNMDPCVLPNLQILATEHDLPSEPVTDYKWGGLERWETRFFEDVESLPKSQNRWRLGELLVGFFHYYTCVFDWDNHAVCMRLCRQGQTIDKFALLSAPTGARSAATQWYVEDPFDLKHNLAGKCSEVGKKRMLAQMAEAKEVLVRTGSWSRTLPQAQSRVFFLKCRISQGVRPEALLEEFDQFDLVKLYFPKPDGTGRMGVAFLEFDDSTNRRQAHTKNETYINDCQLQLHYSAQHSLDEAVRNGMGIYSTFDVASYKMQRQVLGARHSTSRAKAAFQDMPPAAGHMTGDMGYGTYNHARSMAPAGTAAAPPAPPPLFHKAASPVKHPEATAAPPPPAKFGGVEQVKQQLELQQRDKAAQHPAGLADAALAKAPPKPVPVASKFAAEQLRPEKVQAQAKVRAMLPTTMKISEVALRSPHTAASATASAVIEMPVENNIGDIKSCFSQGQLQTIQDFLRTFGPLPIGTRRRARPVGEPVTFNVEVQSSLPEGYTLPSGVSRQLQGVAAGGP